MWNVEGNKPNQKQEEKRNCLWPSSSRRMFVSCKTVQCLHPKVRVSLSIFLYFKPISLHCSHEHLPQLGSHASSVGNSHSFSTRFQATNSHSASHSLRAREVSLMSLSSCLNLFKIPTIFQLKPLLTNLRFSITCVSSFAHFLLLTLCDPKHPTSQGNALFHSHEHFLGPSPTSSSRLK